MIHNPRILVVDDEPKVRSLVASYLTSDGFDVVEASNGEEAVAAAKRRKPDLIIMEIRMPGMDGLEALREIRRNSDVWVILLTARAEETDRIVGLSIGADDSVTNHFRRASWWRESRRCSVETAAARHPMHAAAWSSTPSQWM